MLVSLNRKNFASTTPCNRALDFFHVTKYFPNIRLLPPVGNMIMGNMMTIGEKESHKNLCLAMDVG